MQTIFTYITLRNKKKRNKHTKKPFDNLANTAIKSNENIKRFGT